MGDMGEVFNAYRRDRQEKRRSNREVSTAMLRAAGILFEERNGGAHLVVDGRIDYWPGTGLWIQRATLSKQRGVAALIRFVRATDKSAGGI